jgi:hypothetical protein
MKCRRSSGRTTQRRTFGRILRGASRTKTGWQGLAGEDPRTKEHNDGHQGLRGLSPKGEGQRPVERPTC